MNTPLRARHQQGFALPITIFIVTLITLMLAALFARVSADRVVGESSGDMVDALAIAQGGLQQYLATQATRPGDGDSTRVNLSGGYADVIVRVVQRPADTTTNETFAVRSTGFLIRPAMGSTPQARRTVVQFAEWQVGVIDLVGAFTAANGLQMNGSGVLDIRGADQCGSDPTVAGIRVPNGSSYPGSGISGSPAVNENGNAAAVAAATGIDWNAVRKGQVVADYTTYQPWNFGNAITVINGDLAVSNNGGSGLLVVTGNLTLSGLYFIWYGVILVGGEIHFDATNFYGTRVYGAVVSGLNEQVQGSNPAKGKIATTGTQTYIAHHSCYIHQALASLTGFVPITNAWVENWATY